VLDLCGVQKPDVDLDGHSLLPVIDSDTAASPYQVLHFQWHKSWAVREGDWKLIGRDDRPQASLHNLAAEEPEVVNYARQKPDTVARLRKLHDDWAKDVMPE
jgi:arylsulfatase A-like enzyme